MTARLRRDSVIFPDVTHAGCVVTDLLQPNILLHSLGMFFFFLNGSYDVTL